jgi:serine/threonine-protein kinase
MPAAHTDRNLLFGILALQMDFVSRDALVAAMHAWVLAKDRPLGDLLRMQGALDDDTHALLEALVRKHLALHGDDAEKSLAALSSLGPARDDLEQIADPDVQASLGVVAAARRDEQDDPYATVAPASVGQSTSAGVRFRILRPHAEGGLEIVSVARDEELHREVALKEIKDRYADHPENRARFLLEAEVTGGLEHPGIVPVYGLGSYADGRPFYAMRFIRGDSLKEAVERFHTGPDGKPRKPSRAAFEGSAFRGLLGRFVDVCQAVAYAHSRKVLHRDLKPGNVMLGKYGETLLVDWGLAKPTGPAAFASWTRTAIRRARRSKGKRCFTSARSRSGSRCRSPRSA